MNPPPEGALTISNHTSSIREPKIMPNQSKHRRTEAIDSGSTTSSLYITFPTHTGQRKGTVKRFSMIDTFGVGNAKQRTVFKV